MMVIMFGWLITHHINLFVLFFVSFLRLCVFSNITKYNRTNEWNSNLCIYYNSDDMIVGAAAVNKSINQKIRNKWYRN